MPSKREYVILQEGQILRRDVTEQPVEISSSALNAMANLVPRKLPGIFAIPNWGVANLAVDGANYSYLTIKIPRLTIKAHYRLIDEGESRILVPDFSNQDNASLLSLEWEPEFPLRVLIQCWNEGGTWRTYSVYLFAYDNRGSTYRLPLPNLHDDCKVCTGVGGAGESAATMFDLAVKSINRLSSSAWNADLWKDREKSWMMFRWTSKEDGHRQLAPAASWTNLSVKVSVHAHNFAIIHE